MEETLATVTSIAPAVMADSDPTADMLRAMSGRRKAAILILQMDRRSSARVLSQMRDTELEELAAEIARARDVAPALSAAVLREFGALASDSPTMAGGIEAGRELLTAAIGEQRASEIMGRLSSNLFDMPFKFLQNADSRQLLSFLSDEHPQTIALVLAHVPAPLASKVLGGLGSDLQAEVAHRIATMDRTSPEVIQQVQASLERRMSTMLVPADLSAVGGVQPLVEIINRADRGTEKLILEGLEQRNPELADEVRSRMFVFEDVVNLDDRAVQLVLRQVEVAQLAIALKGVAAVVRNKVMKNMSERAGESLAEEIELLGPVRVQAVEEAQTEVVRVIRQLEEDGQIIVRRGAEDEFVA
ncbi:MAG TPA: flagellar motor switch protein FliG [Jatrophihabitans sp.]|jgi:flagellar motor switch protein FliG